MLRNIDSTLNNAYTGKIIEFHILQNFPVSCLNRDEMGTPKTAIIGGVQRARVSSQCWKRQVRLEVHSLEKKSGNKIGIRTKHVEQKLKEAFHGLASDEDITKFSTAVAKRIASENTLCFLSEGEIEAIKKLAINLKFQVPEGNETTKSEEKKNKGSKSKKDPFTAKLIDVLDKFRKQGLDALDIALFGRMMAQAPEINVEAAASFSHAISTHESKTDFDFFTALDDYQENESAGSAHMGTLEFNSATYYRYISLDIGLLAETLGLEGEGQKENLKTAIKTFILALFKAVPNARQTTMSAAGTWDYAHIYLRHGQRIQASFEKPVKAKDGFLEPSIKELENWLTEKKAMMGSLFPIDKEFILGKNSNTSIDTLIDGIMESL